MNPSPASIGAVMIVFGGFSIFSAAQLYGRPGALCIAVSVAAIAGGLGLLLRRRIGVWIALGAAILTFGVGVVGLWRGLRSGPGLPFHPGVNLVAGLWFAARVAIARVALTPPQFGPPEPEPDDDDRKQPPGGVSPVDEVPARPE